MPERWREHGGVFIPMYQREAMWISFDAPDWHPAAVKVAVGDGQRRLGRAVGRGAPGAAGAGLPGDPPQPWLDGINAGTVIRQFVAMPLGMGYTVEAQVTGREEHGGLQLLALAPRPGLFPDEPPVRERLLANRPCTTPAPSAVAGAEMGLGAGGRMRQKIYPDPHGPRDLGSGERRARLRARRRLGDLRGDHRTARAREPGRGAATYAAHGLPWFDLYDERLGDLPPSEVLARVRSVRGQDRRHGFRDQQDDGPVEVSEAAVRRIPVRPPPQRVADGRR